ncbi:MAG TPA: saccharopine dehydrogenase C-terminal domain-containing protein [Bacteroidia bacterium]|nr:saccharopine dehydrogenase C-terminal domain-containing protein [Bacteroidia bacterium]
MTKICVLGAGMVGGFIAKELSRKYDIRLADRDEKVLKSSGLDDISRCDFRNPEQISSIISDADIVVGAVPGFLGFEAAKTVILNGKNYVDISFFPENPFELHNLATQNESFVAVDCGIAPGLDNMLLGFHNSEMKIKSFACYVGGLPKNPKEPFNYKAPFSPIDVIEEYTRPTRLVRNGKQITLPSLSEPEILEFKSVGMLEAFNTDGLRTLLETMNIENMAEKTLRYKGHRTNMQSLSEMGFFSDEKILLNNQWISPLEMTAAILLPQWKLKPNEEEFTVMRVVIEEDEQSKDCRQFVYDIYDEYNTKQKSSSMSRSTGYTCMAVVEGFINGQFSGSGVFAPEQLTVNKTKMDFVLNYLSDKGIQITLTTK